MKKQNFERMPVVCPMLQALTWTQGAIMSLLGKMRKMTWLSLVFIPGTIRILLPF